MDGVFELSKETSREAIISLKIGRRQLKKLCGSQPEKYQGKYVALAAREGFLGSLAGKFGFLERFADETLAFSTPGEYLEFLSKPENRHRAISQAFYVPRTHEEPESYAGVYG